MPPRCEMLHVDPDENGFAVERACANEATHRTSDDVLICDACLGYMRAHDAALAEGAAPLRSS